MGIFPTTQLSFITTSPILTHLLSFPPPTPGVASPINTQQLWCNMALEKTLHQQPQADNGVRTWYPPQASHCLPHICK